MKKILLSLLLCMALLLTLCSCAKEKYELLYEVNLDGITYCVRGSGTRAKQIVVKNGDTVTWHKKVKVSKKIGSQTGTYGFFAEDLNFDGYRDLRIATDVSGDCVSYICFLYNPATQKYVSYEDLNKLYNVQPNAELKAVFGFDHLYETEPAYNDVPEQKTSKDITTKYVWENGKLTPQMRVSLTHYSIGDRYLYTIAYYDSETNSFFEDYMNEIWMTADEYRNMDLHTLYYFK